MHRFWQPVLKPILEIVRPADIVEIGSDAGVNTGNILEHCKHYGGVLHAVDPAPKFDVQALSERYGDSFQFYRELSLNVIHRLARFDVVLIDGDHNWYTVYNELKLLEKRCFRLGLEFPLVVLHDIAWPYARRDLYYNPGNIPAEFLKPYQKKGIVPGQTDLVEEEGVNPHLCNSIYENDFQNGVLTAIEDFLDDTRFALEFFKIPGLNGLGLLVPALLLKENQALAGFLEQLKIGPEMDRLIDILEADRIQKELQLNRSRKEWRRKNERDVEALKAARASDAEKFSKKIEELDQDNRRLRSSAAELEGRLEKNEAALAESKNEKARLKERLSEAEQEIAGYKESLKKKEQDLAQHAKHIQTAEKNLKTLDNWLDKLTRQAGFLLSSNRWKAGNAMGELTRKLLFRRRRPTAADHIRKISRQYEAWRNHSHKTPGNPGSAAAPAKGGNPGAPPVGADPAAEEVSVIVTVYNAFEEASACIDSILEKTAPPYRLILLDDCSPDERIWPMLSSCAEAHAHVEAVRNERNMGYTATINKGCRLAGDTDVVLLNSDTLVTPGWLDKLRECARRKENVATVTPLSNAAGAFSVPRNNAVNQLPDAMTADDMARLVETLSPRLRPEVPTGNGFCMYVTRKALEEVGLFDEESFPRGYGEENDFCMRALQKGFVNLIDDATYIFHKRSASFKEKKKDIIDESTRRLRSLHPDYKARVSRWLKADPLDDFREHLGKVIKYNQAALTKTPLKSDKPVILYILHSGGGGVLHTSFDLFNEAARHYHCFLLKTGLAQWQLYEAGERGGQVVKEYRFRTQWRIHDPLSGDRLKAIKEIASICSPDIVHIRHFLGNHPEIAGYFKTIGCRVVFSIHDFYTLCPTIQLVDNTGVHCGGMCSEDGGECSCARNWFVSMPPLKNRFVFQWRETAGEALKACDALVVTSESTKELILRHYPFLSDSAFTRIEHGRDFNGYRACSAFPEPGRPMRVVFFGALGMNKGGELVKGMLEYNSRISRPMELHILGNSNLPFRPGKMGCVDHGPYQREDLPEKLFSIEPAAAIIPSVWPETWCHTLTEAWRAKIPVLGSDLGAVGERIRRHGGGWVLSPKDPVQWVEKLVTIAKDPDDYQARVAEIEAMEFRTVAQMGEAYKELYSRLLSGVEERAGVDAG